MNEEASPVQKVTTIAEAQARKRAARAHPSAPPGARRFQVPEPPPIPYPDADIEPPPPPSIDHWSLDNTVESGEYDPDAFYTATSLGEEGSSSLNVTVSRSILYLVESIVQSGRFPDVRVAQDAFRDSIAHWLQRRSRALPPHIQAEIARSMRNHVYLSRMEARARRRREAERVVEVTETELQAAREADDRGAFREIFADAEAQVGSLRGPMRDKLLKVIDDAEKVMRYWESGE